MTPFFSVVIPCFNEEDNIFPLLEELAPVMAATGKPYEIIYINDASTDGTARKLEEAQARYPELRMVTHRFNCGESAGFLTGCNHARGEIIITMDADLQNDPADIPMMLKELEQQDCIAGVRRKRMDSLVKVVSSRVANWFRNAMLHDDIHDAGCTYRIFRREMMECVVPFKGLHRFAPSMWRWQGYRVKEVLINHRPRHKGYSKYGTMNRLWVGIGDIIGMRWFRGRFLPPKRSPQPECARDGD